MVFILKNYRLILRAPEMSDSKTICHFFREESVKHFNSVNGKACNGIEWIKSSKKSFSEKSAYNFVIEFKNEIVGGISLKNINKADRNAELGFWIAKPYRSKGIAFESVGMILKFAFKRLNLNRIEARITFPNVPSANFLGRFNFRLEGRLRQVRHSRKSGWVDENIFSLLKDEFSL